MEGLKCPICEAITLVNPISDGEMFTCPFCKHKFTVTAIRRYFLQSFGKNKEELNLQNFENLLKTLDYNQVFKIIKMTLKEIEKRHNNREVYSENISVKEKGCK